MTTTTNATTYAKAFETNARLFAAEARTAKLVAEIVRLKERLAIERAVKVRREMRAEAEAK
jgi:hypothetical protein